MNFVALRMLTGDRAKYFGLVFDPASRMAGAQESRMEPKTGRGGR